MDSLTFTLVVVPDENTRAGVDLPEIVIRETTAFVEHLVRFHTRGTIPAVSVRLVVPIEKFQPLKR